MELDWTSKELARIIYLLKKSFDKDSVEDQELVWKLIIISKQLKKDEDLDKKLLGTDDD